MSTRIFVGNLPYTATNESLANLFALYGEVSEASVIQDRDMGRSKGFGFIQMDDNTAAWTAIERLNGMVLDDRALRVAKAQPRSDERERPSGNTRRSQRW